MTGAILQLPPPVTFTWAGTTLPVLNYCRSFETHWLQTAVSAGFYFLLKVNCGELKKIDDVQVTNFTPIWALSPGKPTPVGGMGRSFDEHIVCSVEMAGWTDFANPIDLMVTGLKVAQLC